MTNTIITIGREFGSGGCEIGHKLGEFAPTRTFKGHAGEKTTKK